MNLTKKQRIYIIKKLTTEVCENMGKEDGILFLEEYTKQNKEHRDTDNIEQDLFEDFDFLYSDILNFIKDLENETIYKMYKDLFPEEAKTEFLENKKPLYRLSTDKLVLFFSHSHKDVDRVTSVKNILEKTDWIECFVAHKDIKLSKKWEQEIKKYLECCHCLIAFLSENFRSSDYCDQEIGMAVHRDIPIFQFALDNTNSYGFIKHLQAKAFKDPKDSANQIEEYIFDKQEKLYKIAWPKLQKTIETLKNNFLNSTNTQMAESVLNQLMELKAGQIKDQFINEIQDIWRQHSKIKEVKGIEKKMEAFFKKHPQQANKNGNTSHQETSLNSGEKLNTEIDLRRVLEKNKEEMLPF